jgi:response regulator RpfG family c-di-GMP phosphodiesterase
MPAIIPNLLLIDADVAAQERASTVLAQSPNHLVTASNFESAIDILTNNLIDLIICDQNVVVRGQQANDLIARFHQLPDQHDVPVMFTCGQQRSRVSLKKHPWGVAYHVHKTIDPKVLIGLIQTSLTFKVSQCPALRIEKTQAAPTAKVPKPFGLSLPEVIMPPHDATISVRGVPQG